uniref:SPT2 chromatin protein domain containing 1 n=1 Tax=Molossus molossus TaxID=27622 RepID=A0A7J8EUP4_MOLMO|nr:SPT2 chromatin protein domain containing 1 [Molossus molossus]
MEDFIEDEGESQEEISKHIREIFGYDRKKYWTCNLCLSGQLSNQLSYLTRTFCF